MDSATGFKVMLEKKHEAAWLGWGRRRSLSGNTGESFHSDNANKPQTNNLFNVADKELDSLIDAYNVEFDMDKRAALSHQIQQRICMIRHLRARRSSSTTCEPAAGAM